MNISDLLTVRFSFQGALVFGVGTMLYSVLEFGQYYEIQSGAICDSLMMAITPASRFIFSFAQLYLVFVNKKVGA